MTATQGSFAPVLPPYALSSPAFRFRALASLAGRAPLGGPREVALATYLVARLVDDCLPAKELPIDARKARSAAARGWLASAALPAAVRAPIAKLADVTAGEVSEASAALASVIAATGNYLDAPARLELDRLARALPK